MMKKLFFFALILLPLLSCKTDISSKNNRISASVLEKQTAPSNLENLATRHHRKLLRVLTYESMPTFYHVNGKLRGFDIALVESVQPDLYRMILDNKEQSQVKSNGVADVPTVTFS